MITEIAAPTNGAVQKYAPVRAVPICRNAKTNSAKLTPYPKNPTTPIASTDEIAGNRAPRETARLVLTTPAARPLSMAMRTGSLTEIFRVRLLSTAQAKHAPTIASIPNGTPGACPVQAKQTPPAVISPIPIAMRESKCSLNTNHANTAVSAPSRLRRSDALEAEVVDNPIISNTGPITPPEAIDAASHGRSTFVNTAIRTGCVLKRERRN